MTVAKHAKPRICLLGRPKLLAGGDELALPEKSYLLLGLLAVSQGLETDRETVRSLLWRSETPERRAGSLRQLLSRIDQSLPPHLPPVLKTTRTNLSLNDDAWDVDLLLLFRADDLQKPQWTLLEGDLLELSQTPTHGAEEWLTFERQQLADCRVRLLSHMLEEGGARDDEDLLFLAERLLDIDPSHEIAYRTLMLVYARKGDMPAARKAYLRCKARLREDFDTEPEEKTVGLALELGIVQPASPSGVAFPPSGQVSASNPAGEPRIVILPPESILSDPLMMRVGRALLEEVTIGLSQQRGFKIIAAHTSFELVSRAIEPVQFAAKSDDLKFDYSIYVTVRGTGEDVLATCRLTRLSDASVLWAIDLPLTLQTINDSFSRLARRMVTSLTDTIEGSELSKPVADTTPTAYRLYLEGKRLLAGTDLQLLRKARKLFQASLQRCDSFAPAHAGISRSLSLEWLVRFMRARELLDKAKEAAVLARRTDPNNGRVFRELGFIALYQRRFEESLDFFQQARELSPNDADILADYADALSHDGQLDAALSLSIAAFRLNPLPSDHYYWQLGGIYFVQENYEKALEVMEPVHARPATARLLAAIYAMIGDLPQARHYASIVLENFPDFRTEHLWHFVPDRQPDHTKLLIRGLNIAGLQ